MGHISGQAQSPLLDMAMTEVSLPPRSRSRSCPCPAVQCSACEPHKQQQDLSPQHGCSTCSQLTGPFIPSRAGRRDLAASQLPSQGSQACQMARISCRRGLIPLPGGVQGADPPALCLGPSPGSLPGATGHHGAKQGSGWCGARALSSPPPGSHRVQDGICALPFALSFFFAVKMNGHVHQHL